MLIDVNSDPIVLAAFPHTHTHTYNYRVFNTHRAVLTQPQSQHATWVDTHVSFDLVRTDTLLITPTQSAIPTTCLLTLL